MTLKEAHLAFDIEVDKSGVDGYSSFIRTEKDYFLNAAITRLYKTKYSGNNVHGKSFQQNQKRSDDFRLITKTLILAPVSVDGNKYTYRFPSDYWFALGETFSISSTSPSWPVQNNAPVIKKVDVIECTIENIDNRLNNSLSDHILNRDKARPLRVYVGDSIIVYTDGNYSISSYELTYMKKPSILNWNSTSPGYSNDTTQLDVVPDHMWDEVISTAARIALENISDYRYQTYPNESRSVE